MQYSVKLSAKTPTEFIDCLDSFQVTQLNPLPTQVPIGIGSYPYYIHGVH